MSAVERLEGGPGETPASRGVQPGEASSIEAQLTQPPKRPRLRPLLALAPYVARYRGRAFLALIALTVAAVTTLLVPVAVRRLIHFGVSPQSIAMIKRHFRVIISVGAGLA